MMKKVIFISLAVFTTSFTFTQSSCCKGNMKGLSCQKSNVIQSELDDKEIINLASSDISCCKNKSKTNVSCSKNKTSDSTCNSKKWWQIWKKDCN